MLISLTAKKQIQAKVCIDYKDSLHYPWHIFCPLYNNTYSSVQAWKEKSNGKGKLEGDVSKNSVKIANLL